MKNFSNRYSYLIVTGVILSISQVTFAEGEIRNLADQAFTQSGNLFTEVMGVAKTHITKTSAFVGTAAGLIPGATMFDRVKRGAAAAFGTFLVVFIGASI